jgi:hypothetical protein
LLPIAPTLRSGKLDRPVKYRLSRRSNFLAIRGAVACRNNVVPVGRPTDGCHATSAKIDTEATARTRTPGTASPPSAIGSGRPAAYSKSSPGGGATRPGGCRWPQRCRTTSATAIQNTRHTTHVLRGAGSRGCGGSIAVALLWWRVGPRRLERGRCSYSLTYSADTAPQVAYFGHDGSPPRPCILVAPECE